MSAVTYGIVTVTGDEGELAHELALRGNVPIGRGHILYGPREYKAAREGRSDGACPLCGCKWFVRYDGGDADTVDECVACLSAFLVAFQKWVRNGPETQKGVDNHRRTLRGVATRHHLTETGHQRRRRVSV